MSTLWMIHSTKHYGYILKVQISKPTFFTREAAVAAIVFPIWPATSLIESKMLKALLALTPDAAQHKMLDCSGNLLIDALTVHVINLLMHGLLYITLHV